MNKHLKKALTVLVLLFIIINSALNIVLKRIIEEKAPSVNFLFAVSPLPDRVILAGVKTGQLTCPAAMIDINLRNSVKRDFDRAVDGIVLLFPKFVYYKKMSSGTAQEKTGFIIPHCKYIHIAGGTAEYIDEGRAVRFGLYSIGGKSEYAASEVKSGEFMAFNMTGYLQGDRRYPVKLNFFYFPYFVNRFHMNMLAEAVDARIFEPFFADYRVVIENGGINLAIQATGENRRVRLSSAMEIKRLKMKEDTDGIDIKQLFGVSYEQMGRFLTDSNGDMRVDFQFDIPDSQLASLPAIYGRRFASEMGDRVKIGIITAPLRGVTDLLWNITGANVVNFLKLFENQPSEEE